MKHLIFSFIVLIGFISCSDDEIQDTFDLPLITCDSFEVHMEVLEFPAEKRVEIHVEAIENGVPPYRYEWSTGETTSMIAVTNDGLYTLSVIDSMGCSEIIETNIDYLDNPCEGFSARIEEIARGNLGVVISGGKAPYSYEWSNVQTEPDIMVTQGGTYRVTVTDSRSCRRGATINVRLFDPCAAFRFLSYKWNPDTEELSVKITGGTAPHRYEWSTGETTPTIIAEEGVSYVLVITDSQNCELIIDIPLPQ